MCSQSDFVHDDLPAGQVSAGPKLEAHASRRKIRSAKSGAAVAHPGTTGTFANLDELTLRMIFGDR